MKNETKIVHKGRNSTKHFGTVNPPVYFSSTIIFPTTEAFENAERGKDHYEPLFSSASTDISYGIAGNQTNFALQEVINELEGGHGTLITSSGLSAITLVLSAFLKAGDHLLVTDSVYGPTRRFCNKTLQSFGIETDYYDPENIDDLKSKIKPNTKVIFLESPGSLTFEIQDLEAISKIAREKNIITALDNSWATPLYLNPLEHGIDISIHAITKYINGHSDVLLGAVVCNKETYSKVSSNYKNFGYSASPRDCYEALRGIRSLTARLEYQQRSLEKVLSYLEKQKCVGQILAPSHKTFSGNALWKKYFKGSSSLFSVILDKKYSDESVAKMIDDYEYFAIGASWGGYESLARRINLEGTRTVTAGKYTTNMIRYYIGLENADDLIADLDNGFKRLL